MSNLGDDSLRDLEHQAYNLEIHLYECSIALTSA
jgi:hypothetical protein